MKIMYVFQLFIYQISSKLLVVSLHRINGMKQGSYAYQVRYLVKFTHQIKNNFLGTNVYDIAVRTKNFEKLARSIREDRAKDLSFIPAVRHGILNGEVCRRRYVTEKAASKLFSSSNI